MRRRSKAGAKAGSGRGVARGRKPLRSARARKITTAKRETTVARLARELKEALAQQKATSEVLRTISSSSGDLQPVFATILANAVSVCDADNGAINRWDGEALLPCRHTQYAVFFHRTCAGVRRIAHRAFGLAPVCWRPKSFIHIADLAADRPIPSAIRRPSRRGNRRRPDDACRADVERR